VLAVPEALWAKHSGLATRAGPRDAHAVRAIGAPAHRRRHGRGHDSPGGNSKAEDA